MTAQELITELQKLDPNCVVFVVPNDADGVQEVLGVTDIERTEDENGRLLFEHVVLKLENSDVRGGV